MTHLPRSSPVRAGVALALLAAALPRYATAAPFEFTPSAELDVDHSDNLFLAPSDPALAAVSARPLVADTLTTLQAGLQVKREDAGSNAYARGSALKVKYKDFSELDHDEYSAVLGYRLGAQKGNNVGIEAGAARKLVPFTNLADNNLFALERDRYAQLTGGLLAGDAGRLDLLLQRSEQRSPVPGAPEYAVSEDAAGAGFTRGALQSLEYGARVNYAHGHYSGLANLGDYRAWRPELFLRREIKGLVNMRLAIGATQRNQDGLRSTSGLTGSGEVHYDFTARTSAYVGLNREVTGYYASAGTQVNTSYMAGASWAASYRLTLALDYNRTHSTFNLQGVSVDRVDNYQAGTLSLKWQLRPWFGLSAYVRRQTRDSNDALYLFDSNSEGIAFRLQRPAPR